jgi:protein tyrosine phosphatase (PTP) superfamily phosphohydrolase (DUF442 family)
MTASPASIKWVQPGILARGTRPGWPEKLPSVESVEMWADEAASLGIKSIICLLSKSELDEMYGTQGIDLLKIYRQKCFGAKHIPAIDHALPTLNDTQITSIIAAFELARKPVLIHCSAGICRTGAAIRAVSIHKKSRSTDGYNFL